MRSSSLNHALSALLLTAALACTTAAQPTASPADPFQAAADAARARATILAERGGPYTAEEAREVLTLALRDVDRFTGSGAFRARALDALPSVLPADAPSALRDRLLYELATGPGLTFDQSEALELTWGAAVRATGPREVDSLPTGLTFPDETGETGGTIAATVFSFPSRWFDGPASMDRLARLLRAVRERSPEREIVVLADLPVREALAGPTAGLGIHWIASHGRPYSPWPRDPFSTARLPGGGLVLVNRPDFQGGREGDAWMARELIQNLPADLDRAWGGPGEEPAGVRWGEAPFFFHNGHVVMAGGAAWTSIHGLERRALAILGLERVPVASFATAEGIDRYAAAVRQAAGEMSAFYGKPVRLVHPLPSSDATDAPVAHRTEVMRAIGGGASIDLDSIVSFTGSNDGLVALVGDLDAGRELLAGLGNDDLASLRRTYGFAPPPRDLQGLLTGAQRAHRAAGLDAFLEQAADHLAASGLTVRRLPLLMAPQTLLADRELYDEDFFLIGWHNVVQESREGRGTAEGFASGIPAGDERARAIYGEAGVDLVLLPPLPESVTTNGGYRCASNQVRHR